MKKKAIFIAWTQISRRSEELSKRIDAEYINLGRVDRPWYKRIFYIIFNFIRTYSIFIKKKPGIIYTFHAHPFISLVAIIYKFNHDCKVIPDLHSAAYLDYYQTPYKKLICFIFKHSDQLIVHNINSVNYINEILPGYMNKLFVLEDPLPGRIKSKIIPGYKKEKKITGVLVSRFSADENITDLIEKVKHRNDIFLYITGDFRKSGISVNDRIGVNYELTGFISDDNYWQLISNVDFVIALTTRENTLLSAGYEALSLEKPLIISSTDTLGSYFGKNVVYIEKELTNIDEALDKIITGFKQYQQSIKLLRREKKLEWNIKSKGLIKVGNYSNTI